MISADGKSAVVSVNGSAFEPRMSAGAMGVHVHNGEVFVPLRELAQAAGLKLEMDAEKGIAGFVR